MVEARRNGCPQLFGNQGVDREVVVEPLLCQSDQADLGCGTHGHRQMASRERLHLPDDVAGGHRGHDLGVATRSFGSRVGQGDFQPALCQKAEVAAVDRPLRHDLIALEDDPFQQRSQLFQTGSVGGTKQTAVREDLNGIHVAWAPARGFRPFHWGLPATARNRYLAPAVVMPSKKISFHPTRNRFISFSVPRRKVILLADVAIGVLPVSFQTGIQSFPVAGLSLSVAVSGHHRRRMGWGASACRRRLP